MFENIFKDYLGTPRRTHYNQLPESKAEDPRPYERVHIYKGISWQQFGSDSFLMYSYTK